MSPEATILAAEMQRYLIWMEHENTLADRETKSGGPWLTDHTLALQKLDKAYQMARDTLMKLKE